VLDDDTIAFLVGGCALIVGTVSPDGDPHASRGWGLTVLGTGPLRARLLLAADDARTLANLEQGARVAVTAGDVPTLRSMQLKGRSLGLEPGTEDDRARMGRFVEGFYGDISSTDGTPRRVLDRLTPLDVTACTIEVEELYDQTPGPSAGARLERT
jgi:hypothetical protein